MTIIKTPWYIKNDPWRRWRLTRLVVTGKFINAVSIRVSDLLDGAGAAVSIITGLDGTSESQLFNLSLDTVFKAKVRVDITGTTGNTPEVQSCFIEAIPESRFDDYANNPENVKPAVFDMLNIRGRELVDIPFDRGHSEGEKATAYDLQRGYTSILNMVPFDFSYNRQTYRAVYDPQDTIQSIDGTLALNGVYMDNSGLLNTEPIPRYLHNNFGRTNWAEGHSASAENIPLGTGSIVHEFNSPDEVGLVIGRYMYGNNAIYNYKTMDKVKELPALYGSWGSGDCRKSLASFNKPHYTFVRTGDELFFWWRKLQYLYQQGACIGIYGNIRYIILDSITSTGQGKLFLIKDNLFADEREVIEVITENININYGILYNYRDLDYIYFLDSEGNNQSSFPLFSFEYSYANVSLNSNDDGDYIECKVFNWDNEEVFNKRYYYEEDRSVYLMPILYSDGRCGFYLGDFPSNTFWENETGEGNRFYYSPDVDSDWQLIAEDIFYLLPNIFPEPSNVPPILSGYMGNNVQWIMIETKGETYKISVSDIPTLDTFTTANPYMPWDGYYFKTVASNENYRVILEKETYPIDSGLVEYAVYSKFNEFITYNSFQIPWHPDINQADARNTRRAYVSANQNYNTEFNTGILTDDNILYVDYFSFKQNYDSDGVYQGTVRGVIGFNILTNEVVFHFQDLRTGNDVDTDPHYTKLYLFPDGKIGLALYAVAPAHTGTVDPEVKYVIIEGDGEPL